MSTDDFGSSYLERAWEAPEEVVLRRELVRTPGLQPEDLGVLAELLLRDPRLPSTMEAIRRDLQAQGWKMGKDRYNAISKRLTDAGHLARVPAFDEATSRPTWVTRVYRNPANNTQYVDLGIAASVQVNAEVRENRDPLPHGLRETRVSPGQSRNAENPQSGSESRETRDLETRVSPGQSRNAENPRSASPPPHPPEEVTTSSPYPLTNTGGPTGLPSPREEGEGAVCSEDDLRVAADVLELLPAPWTQGRLNAGKLAPKLLTVMAAQGWPEIGVVDRGLLIRQLTKNPHKVSNPYRLLAGDRIPNLPRYAVVAAEAEAARPPGATTDGMCPKHPTYRAGNRCIPCITA
ncbi:hypothetical protein OHB41_50700 [Streptomyces sp. NBC_01571]|uniref:hypothetical protein n=1 Tax=Streptomyces sp. NBC_01571 TaxID=2975883 RepID=UPI0022513A5B|nr:hypothetical protein [Streptomyces sp. NBC_01571]MCX4581230.1 hypothetical protein [Streptomyces sp. NBC_01571]